MIRSIVLFLLLTLSALGLAADRKPADLDQLASDARPFVEGVYILAEPVHITTSVTLDTLPKAGKTAYMQQTMRLFDRGPYPEVHQKMWVRGIKGSRVMLYLTDEVTQGLESAEIQPGDEFTIHATQYWQYHRGPGLLVTDFEIAP